MPLTQRQIVDSILPEIEIKEITIETPEVGEGQVFTVEYSIYDVIDNDQISRFFAKPEFEKYLKFTFDYSKSPGKDYYAPVSPAVRARRDADERQGVRETKGISEILGSQNFKEKVIEDGTSIREFTYQKKYTFDKKCEHLEFFVRSYVDIEGIEREAGLAPGTFTINTENTTKSDHVIVMKKGRLEARKVTYVYTDLEDDIAYEWRGKVYVEHEYDSRGEVISTDYYTQHRNSMVARKPLEKTETPFTEIQNFQRRKSPEKKSQSVGYLKRIMTNAEEKSIRQNTRSDMQKSTTSSEMWISRTLSGATNFMFCLDIKNLLIKESKFNYYFDNLPESTLNSIVDRVHILSLKIFRRRVSVHQTTGAPIVVDYKDDIYTNEFVVETSKRPQTPASQSLSVQGAIRQVEIPQEPGLLFFTGTDYAMSEITDGSYCYGYELKILDPTKQFLADEISKLQPTLSTLKSIYEYLMNGKDENGIAYYNSNKDMFNIESLRQVDVDLEDFSLTPEEVFEDDGQVYKYAEFVRRAVAKYDKAHEIFKDKETLISFDHLGAYLLGRAARKPQGLEIIIQMYESLISRLSRIIGIDEPRMDFYSGKTSISGNLVQEIVSSRVYDELNEIVDSNIPKGNGINYLEDPSLEFDELSTFDREFSQVGLRVISGATWERRQLSENTRYFNKQYANISLPIDDTNVVQSFDLTAAGSEFLTPSLYHVNNEHLVNNIEDRESPAIILDVASNFTLSRPSASPAIPMPAPPAPPTHAAPSLSSGVGLTGRTTRPSIRSFRNSVATDAFSPYNVLFEDFEEAVSSIERYDIAESIEEAIRNCLFTRTNPVDPIDGWSENSTGSGNESVVLDPESPPSQTPQFMRRVTDNFGINMLASFRSSFLSPSGISTGNFSSTPDSVQAQRPTSSSFDISRDNFATSFVSSVPSADRVPMISRLPNQIKAMLLSSLPEQESSVNRSFSVLSSPSGTYEVSVGFLASIEYFAGFGKRSSALVVGTAGMIEVERQGNSIERSDVGSPVWLPLSAQVYAENKDVLLLCRIKKEHFEDLGIRATEFGVPVYDSYFLIKPLQNAIIDADGEGVDASRRARAIEAVRSEVSRRMEETELDKARLLRQVERLRSENERLQQSVTEHTDNITRYETEAMLIFTFDDNYIEDLAPVGTAPAIHPWNGGYSVNSIRRNMKSSPKTRFFELISLRDATMDARYRLTEQIASNEEIIAGYQIAISSATDTVIDTVEDVTRAHFNLKADMQTLQNELNSVAADREAVAEQRRQLFMTDEYLRDTYRREQIENYVPQFRDLNAQGKMRHQLLTEEYNRLWDVMEDLQRQIRELGNIADEGEYL